MYIQILYRSKTTNRNNYCILCTYGNASDFDRTIRHIGFGKAQLVAERKMNEIEAEDYEKSSRFNYVKYTNWEDLINDEKAIAKEGNQDITEFLEKIQAFKKKHPILQPSMILEGGEQLGIEWG
ncbi:MAG: hypothetical protein AAF806_30950 [Bacteroidota bacterium]